MKGMEDNYNKMSKSRDNYMMSISHEYLPEEEVVKFFIKYVSLKKIKGFFLKS